MDKIVITDEANRKVRRILEETDVEKWYALSAPFQHELDAQKRLDNFKVRNYVPMHWVIKSVHGSKKRVLEPVIHNLIFAYATKSRIREIKLGYQYLQFKTGIREGRKFIVSVPEDQMEQFIRICDARSENVKFFEPGELNIPSGTKVRILGGDFTGIVGTFVSVRGSRSRKVIVQIPWVTTVVIAELTADLIEVLKD